MLTTCILGGMGFIGQVVVRELLQRGDRQIIVVGREKEPLNVPASVRYIQHPPEATADLIAQTLLACDEVIDLAYATVPQTSFQNPVNDILVNVPEAVRLFELAAQLPLRKFVWVSSGGTVYGPAQTLPITEDHPTKPISPYGITKLTVEKYAYLYHHIQQLPIVCVRPSNAFGEGQRVYAGQGFIGTAIASLLDGRVLNIFGQEGTVRDYLHVQDMARGIIAALLGGLPGEVYNLGSGQGYNNTEIINLLSPLAAEQGLEVKVQLLPERHFDVKANILDSSKLQDCTGWQPAHTFEEKLRQTWYWYVENYERTPVK